MADLCLTLCQHWNCQYPAATYMNTKKCHPLRNRRDFDGIPPHNPPTMFSPFSTKFKGETSSKMCLI